VVIDEVVKTKFLGVIINSTLTWQDHIKTVCNKVSKSIGILYKVRKNVKSDILLTLYHTLIEPYFLYCNIVWASQNTVYLHKLLLKQKKAVRIVTCAKWDAHTQPIFKELNLLTIPSLNLFQIYCFMYKVSKGLMPSAFQNLFVENFSVHDHFTRQSAHLHIVKHRTTTRAFSIKIYGAKLWNDLTASAPDEIIHAPSFPVFKSKCKRYIISKQ
jgi:hypothetical protein